MHTIERLIQDHQALDNMALEIIEMVQPVEPRAIEVFNRLRSLSACLDEHLASEQGFLYADHFQAKTARLDEEVAAFERAFEDLKEEWALYLQEWTPDNIAIDWRNFSHATQWIMGRLRERIAQENDILYPLALQCGRIRLRDVPKNNPQPNEISIRK